MFWNANFYSFILFLIFSFCNLCWAEKENTEAKTSQLPNLPRNSIEDPLEQIHNQQEVNYTKALVYYNQKEYGHAFSFLAKNLKFDLPPHQETLELLSMIHEQRGDLIKAIRAQYYLIKKFNGDEILRARDLEETQKRLQTFKKEHGNLSEKVLAQYFKLADLYTKLYSQDQNATENVKEHVHQNAFKYYTVCNFFHYHPEQVNFALGLLYRASGQPHKASKHLREAREQVLQIKDEHLRKLHEGNTEYAPEQELDEEVAGIDEFRNHINLYLAESFLYMGNADLSLNFLRSTPDQDLDPSIKNMARLFYDSLSNDYLVLNAAYTYGHDNNIYSLNDSDKGSFNQNSDYYGKQEGNYDTKTFTAFYNSKSFYSNAFVVNAGVNETLYKENSKISRADTRHYYGGVEFKHFRDENKGALRFGVNTYTTFVKRSPEGGFSYESMLTTFTPLTDFWTKYGAISIGAPFKIDYNQNTNGQSREYGGSLGLIPWGINRYLSPSANMNITYLEGGGLSSDANKYLFSLANLAQMGDFFSLYANASYFLNDAQGLSDRYEVTSGNITAIWSLRTILTGLMFRLAWDESLVRTGEHYSNHTHRRLLSSTLNFTF